MLNRFILNRALSKSMRLGVRFPFLSDYSYLEHAICDLPQNDHFFFLEGGLSLPKYSISPQKKLDSFLVVCDRGPLSHIDDKNVSPPKILMNFHQCI